MSLPFSFSFEQKAPVKQRAQPAPQAAQQPISFALGAQAPAAAKPPPKAKASAKAKASKVKSERPVSEAAQPVVTKRVRVQPDYKALNNVNVPPPQPLTSPAVSKKSNSALSKSKNKATTKKSKLKKSSANSGGHNIMKPLMGPVPREMYAQGPPWCPADFSPEELLPKRGPPPAEPEDTPEEARAKQELQLVEERLAALDQQSRALEGERALIEKNFDARKIKLRGIRRALEKPRKSSSAATGLDSSFGGSTRNRASNKRSGSGGGGGGGGGGDYGGYGLAALPPHPPVPKARNKDLDSKSPFEVKCIRMLEELMRMPEAFYFVDPVDLTLYPNYAQVVARPLCFKQVWQACMDGEYASADEVMADIKVIYQNCLTFNGLESPVTADCSALRERAQKRVSRIKTELKSQKDRGKKKKPRPPKELTYQEKEQLVHYIGELPPEALANVVQMVAEAQLLDGGDQKEVELDVSEMSTELLRKLQDFVFDYRKRNGLPIEQLAPAAIADDAQFQVDEPAPKKKRQKKKKAKKEGAPEPKKYERKPAVAGPRTQEELLKLADKTAKNTEDALAALHDQLHRLAGKVVESDHVQGGEGGANRLSAASEYSMDPAVLAQQLAAQEDDEEDSLSSDTVSSDDEDDGPTAAPHIISAREGANEEIVIENAAGWAAAEEGVAGASPAMARGANGDGAGAADEPGNAQLWEQFAGQNQQQLEQDKARKAHEEQLKKEREAKEEELRRVEREKRQREEEEERKRQEEIAAQERELQRQREEERMQRKRERESAAEGEQIVKLDEQQELMNAFTRE